MSDETTITPALTPEEWGTIVPAPEIVAGEGGEIVVRQQSVKPLPVGFRPYIDVEDRPHAIAAAALYGQPFGFTHEDAELLDTMARHDHEGMPLDTPDPELLRLAAKIAALLPPAKPAG